MNTPLGLIGKHRPIMATSPTASQAILSTTTAQAIASVSSMTNHLPRRKGDQVLTFAAHASRWDEAMSKD